MDVKLQTDAKLYANPIPFFASPYLPLSGLFPEGNKKNGVGQRSELDPRRETAIEHRSES
jgi:hypothetical protein